MRGKIVLAGLILALSGGALAAQERGLTTTQDDIYCSGTITNESVPRDTYVITGEESNYKNHLPARRLRLHQQGLQPGRQGRRPVFSDPRHHRPD